MTEGELEAKTKRYDHVIQGGNDQLEEYGETSVEAATVRSS